MLNTKDPAPVSVVRTTGTAGIAVTDPKRSPPSPIFLAERSAEPKEAPQGGTYLIGRTIMSSGPVKNSRPGEHNIDPPTNGPKILRAGAYKNKKRPNLLGFSDPRSRASKHSAPPPLPPPPDRSAALRNVACG